MTIFPSDRGPNAFETDIKSRRLVEETHAGPVWQKTPDAPYWITHMIAENDCGSSVYRPNATEEERNAMARSIHEAPEGLSEFITRECTPYKPVFDHVMIDIETMSLHKHKALILSVGMIEFDPRDDKKLHLGAEDGFAIDAYAQLLLGRRVDVGTQEFWAKEHKKNACSSANWLAPASRVSPQVALETIRVFCKDEPNIWANGSQFDLSNLEGLAEDIGYTEPLWHYQAPRDMRTFMKTTKSTRVVPIGDALDIPGVPHDPIYDCISQAYRVWGNWQ